MVIPGMGCLNCISGIDVATAQQEMLPEPDRQVALQLGYIAGADVPAPAVAPLNGVIASLAVTEFMAWATGFKPLRRFIFYDFVNARVTPYTFKMDPSCFTCSATGSLAVGDSGCFLGYVDIDEEQRTLYIRTLAPVKVPTSKRQEVAELLMRVNQRFLLGNFDLNMDSGVIAYKTSVMLGDSSLHDDIIEHLLYANWRAVDRYFPFSGLMTPTVIPDGNGGFAAASERESLVISSGSIGQSNLWRDFGVICRRARLERWPKWCHVLRKNCETDWAQKFPQYVVSAWSGHGMEVSARYYLQVPEQPYHAVATPAIEADR